MVQSSNQDIASILRDISPSSLLHFATAEFRTGILSGSDSKSLERNGTIAELKSLQLLCKVLQSRDCTSLLDEAERVARASHIKNPALIRLALEMLSSRIKDFPVSESKKLKRTISLLIKKRVEGLPRKRQRREAAKFLRKKSRLVVQHSSYDGNTTDFLRGLTLYSARIFARTKKPAQALELISRAEDRYPFRSLQVFKIVHNEKANALESAGKFTEAADSYRKIRRRPWPTEDAYLESLCAEVRCHVQIPTRKCGKGRSNPQKHRIISSRLANEIRKYVDEKRVEPIPEKHLLTALKMIATGQLNAGRYRNVHLILNRRERISHQTGIDKYRLTISENCELIRKTLGKDAEITYLRGVWSSANAPTLNAAISSQARLFVGMRLVNLNFWSGKVNAAGVAAGEVLSACDGSLERLTKKEFLRLTECLRLSSRTVALERLLSHPMTGHIVIQRHPARVAALALSQLTISFSLPVFEEAIGSVSRLLNPITRRIFGVTSAEVYFISRNLLDIWQRQPLERLPDCLEQFVHLLEAEHEDPTDGSLIYLNALSTGYTVLRKHSEAQQIEYYIQRKRENDSEDDHGLDAQA